MKVYVTTRFEGATQNRHEIDALCHAVKEAGMQDFNFIRDIEHYKHTFDDPKELWERAYDELGACDALLVDVSDHPTGGRIVEAGMAYALRKPIIVVKKHGIQHKALFDGIATKIIEYDTYKDLTKQLRAFEAERNFSVTDRSTLLIMFLSVGAVLGWFAAQLHILLGLIIPIVYWLAVRALVPMVKAFDRIVIYIPLIVIWASGFYLLQPLYMPLALAWGVMFWIVALLIIRKLKFSL